MQSCLSIPPASISAHKVINDAEHAASEFCQIKYLVERIRGSIWDHLVISGERKVSLERINSDRTRGNGNKVRHGRLLLDSGFLKKTCFYYENSKTLKFVREFVESPSREFTQAGLLALCSNWACFKWTR